MVDKQHAENVEHKISDAEKNYSLFPLLYAILHGYFITLFLRAERFLSFIRKGIQKARKLIRCRGRNFSQFFFQKMIRPQ